MKKIMFLSVALFAAMLCGAQELPYSKYLNFTKSDFKENHFKYHENTNTWFLTKTSALNTTFNILAIIADADEEVRPSSKDYTILVQFGKDDMPAFVRVICYNDDTYHKLLTFIKTNCQDIIDVSSGNITKYLTSYGDYAIELKMEQHNISRISARTADPLALKKVDESYNEYEFIIRTGVEPWSKELEKQAQKLEKRDAKGKKKQNVDDLM